jgi:hypothetical protein
LPLEDLELMEVIVIIILNTILLAERCILVEGPAEIQNILFVTEERDRTAKVLNTNSCRFATTPPNSFPVADDMTTHGT